MASITDERLKELEDAEEKLNALEIGGVDNWDGYDFAMEPIRRAKERYDALDTIAGEIVDEISEHVEEPAGQGCGYGVRDTAYPRIIGILNKHLAEFAKMHAEEK